MGRVAEEGRGTVCEQGEILVPAKGRGKRKRGQGSGRAWNHTTIYVQGSRMMVLYLGLAGAAGGGWGWEIFGEDYVVFVNGVKTDSFSRPRFRVEAHSCCLSSFSAKKALDDS